MSQDSKPFVLVTALLDGAARPAALTRSHGDALERAFAASAGQETAGVDLVELKVAPKVFAALRKAMQIPKGQVALYDVFPSPAHLDAKVRKVAGQFLAAEVLWTLEEQGLLEGVALNVRLDLPKDWDRDLKAVHARLVEGGALDLSEEAVATFIAIKKAWAESA